MFSNFSLIRNALWTTAGHAFGQASRLLTNVVLSRLLTPEVLGLMVIINTLRTGIELVSDIGVSQSIVQNKNADRPDFYNTVWTLRLIRAVLLCGITAVVAVPVAHFYDAPILASVLPVAGLSFVIAGFGSLAVPFMQKRMRFRRLNSFDAVLEAISSVVHIVLVYANPTIWSLVIAGLISYAAKAFGTYFILRDLRHRLRLAKDEVGPILRFGKWIFLASGVYFLSSNFDRIFLGKVLALEVLGVFGIAKTLSEIVSGFMNRVNMNIVLPLISSGQDQPRSYLRSQVSNKRFLCLLASAIGIATLVCASDIAISTLYDARYRAAAWMLPILLVGSWFGILAGINETTLVGLGKPSFGAASNATKLLWMIVSVPGGYLLFGLVGAVVATSFADISRYVVAMIGQFRAKVSFVRQDAIATLLLFLSIFLFDSLRQRLGFGSLIQGLLLEP